VALESDIRMADEAGRSRSTLDSSYAEARALALIGSAGTTAEQDRAAALTLAEWARDGNELADWLEMCGLARPKSAATGVRS
jgi:hypothetical protein